MNERQLKDAEECNSIAEQGKEKDCFECSCNTCIANYESQLREENKKLRQAILECKKAVDIAVSNGGGAWHRHVMPAVYNAASKLK